MAGTTDARAADTTGRGGPVASAAFVADGRFVARVVGRHGTLPGGTGVLLRAAPGRYAVTAGCDGRTVKGPLTVGAPRAAAPTGPVLPPALASPAPRTPPSASRPPMAAPTPTPTGRESRSVPLSPSAPSSPVAPVPAGGGGTARVASSGARNTGPGVGQAVIGLVLASAAAVAVFARGARRDPGAE
ncbi:hypothetical protein [Streptomyces sp. NPDC007264]|uniref:hypothetical protein n=1 Tax=Streptomyces sp. NPDC007264 TaxID=3364777 RepID=UPI0036D9BB44